ncbi:hypothetical protein E4U41_002785 [Claviceps citrina]|nr:hypothetical protein E4U41_002785 [Claviceps citrina]
MSALISILGWSFLPDLVTSFVQTIYYGITIRAGSPKPKSGSPQHARHRRRIQILVMTAYLLYTVYEAGHDVSQTPSYYTELGVPITATDREIKSRFRRLAALHHPDKKTSSEAAAAAAAGESAAAYFMHLKRASDTLQDSAGRFAYERFGDDVTSWDWCVTVRDYVRQGVLHNVLPHYGAAAAMVYLLGVFGYAAPFGHFYRWLILMTLCLAELHAVTRADFPPLLKVVNALLVTLSSRPPFLPFQFIALGRKLALTGYFALSHIAPLLMADTVAKEAPAKNEDEAVRESLSALETVSKQLEADAGRLMDMEIAPFKGDTASIDSLRSQMREWLVQNTIRADPMVKDALRTALKKGRNYSLAGEKGNR